MIPYYPISDLVLRLPSVEMLLQGASGGGNTITFAFLVEREKI